MGIAPLPCGACQVASAGKMAEQGSELGSACVQLRGSGWATAARMSGSVLFGEK